MESHIQGMPGWHTCHTVFFIHLQPQYSLQISRTYTQDILSKMSLFTFLVLTIQVDYMIGMMLTFKLKMQVFKHRDIVHVFVWAGWPVRLSCSVNVV